ncbi:MAG: chorismate-binding protein [Bacteroidales bacterium]|nr:chorismate-binding protein [Bacteroidales bacterium]MCF8457255.1 chorismate-binding protein [Bacteroidales bacterium]
MTTGKLHGKDLRLTKLQNYLLRCIDTGVAFVAYRLPEQHHIHISLIKPDGIKRLENPEMMNTSKGFVFHPFEESVACPALFLEPSLSFTQENIPHDHSLTHPETLGPGVSARNQRPEQEIKSIHQSGVKEILRQIETGDLEKAVLSREKFVPGYSIEQGPELFLGLTQTYPNAFVYFLYLPGTMSWMGASPEILLEKKGNHYHTISLAGTAIGNSISDIAWSKKEIHEQKLVSNFIEETLSTFQIENLNKTGPKTVQAGNLFHLRSDYEFEDCQQKVDFGRLAAMLHPTPAVCGLPRDVAKATISKVEKHDRAYYSGFLGPVDPQGESNLFVNLRCLQFVEGGLLLYAGGGITKGSVAGKEWDETTNKANTLLSVIEKISKFA